MQGLRKLKDLLGRLKEPHLAKLSQRDSLNIIEFWRTYSQSEGLLEEDVLELLDEVCTWLKVPKDKVRPEDELVKDLSFVFLIDSPHSENLQDIIRERADKLGGDVHERIDSIRTLDDYIQAFSRKRKGT